MTLFRCADCGDKGVAVDGDRLSRTVDPRYRMGYCRIHGAASLFTLQPVAPTRSTDPETSKLAARTVDLSGTRRSVLWALTRFGPLTDEQLVEKLAEAGIRISPSGARTRRAELVELGLVEDTGQTSVTKSGRATVVWSAREGVLA